MALRDPYSLTATVHVNWFVTEAGCYINWWSLVAQVDSVA